VRYRDRFDAGQHLADALGRVVRFAATDRVVVLGIPRGGVPVAAVVAERNSWELDVLVAHKIGAPGNPEFAVGAVAEGGVRILDDRLIERHGISDAYIEEETERQRREVERRARHLRDGRRPVSLEDRPCVVVDDGVATGSTLEASLRLVARFGASRVIAAVPVGPPDTVRRISRIVDRFVCPVQPAVFFAVGAWYDDFTQVPDETVIEILRNRRAE
jgi:putative phosphoribosyl transferase